MESYLPVSQYLPTYPVLHEHLFFPTHLPLFLQAGMHRAEKELIYSFSFWCGSNILVIGVDNVQGHIKQTKLVLCILATSR